jgi:hypothetical protein
VSRLSVPEYLTLELLEFRETVPETTRIPGLRPISHIMLANRNDEELNRRISNITISFAGVVTHIDDRQMNEEGINVPQELRYVLL